MQYARAGTGSGSVRLLMKVFLHKNKLRTVCFYQRPESPTKVICILFFPIASLRGGRAPDQGPIIIALVIHVS